MSQTLDALKKALPDSRPREQRGQIRTPHGLASPIYCANCGKFKGYVFVSTEFMFYLCDDCDRFGNGLEIPIVDEQTVKAVNQGGD